MEVQQYGTSKAGMQSKYVMEIRDGMTIDSTDCHISFNAQQNFYEYHWGEPEQAPH